MHLQFLLAIMLAVAVGTSAQGADAQSRPTAVRIDHDTELRSAAPIPAAERNLHNMLAAPFAPVSKDGIILEGPSFARNGELFFSDSTNGVLMRLARDKSVSRVTSFDGMGIGGTAVHRDGRIFVAAHQKDRSRGSIAAVDAAGGRRQLIVGPEEGFIPNDLVFDNEGGFYFTDFRGSASEPRGGVYYVSPDFRTITPILRGLARANGVALSPDGMTLWVVEHGRSLLHKIDLATATTIKPLGTSVPYTFSGPPPDSMRVDSKGNLYVAMMRQGRVLVMAPNGVPVGQILLPQRQQGHHLGSTSLAISPTSDDLFIVASDLDAGRGAAIFRASAYARGLSLYSHR